MNEYFILSNIKNVPNRLTKKILTTGQSMVESGLNEFYFSYAKFLGIIRNKDGQWFETNHFEPLKLSQFYFPLIIYGLSMMIAVIVFIIELIVYRVEKQQIVKKNRNHRPPVKAIETLVITTATQMRIINEYVDKNKTKIKQKSAPEGQIKQQETCM